MKQQKLFQWYDFTIVNLKKNSTVDTGHISKMKMGVNFFIALCIAEVVFLLGFEFQAFVIMGISTALIAVSITSRNFRKITGIIIRKTQIGVSTVLNHLLLLPFLWLVFPFIRLISYLSGYDYLHKNRKNETSCWLFRDEGSRKYYINLPYSKEVTEKKPSIPKFVILELLIIILIFVFGEFALRFYGFGDPLLYITPSEIGYIPKPNQEIQRYGGRVFINSFGMRSAEFSEKKSPDVYRIFMIGDSTLYGGSYIDQKEMFSEILKINLNNNLDLFPDHVKKIEILTLGVNGWGVHHKLAYLKKYGLYDSDRLIVVLSMSDIDRRKYGLEMLPFFHASKAPLFAWEEVFNHLMWRFRQKYLASNKDEIKKGIKSYIEIAGIGIQNRTEVSFLVIPNRNGVLSGKDLGIETPLFRTLKNKLKVKKVELFSIVAYLFKYRKSKDLYHDNIHLGVVGHSLIAAFLYEELFGGQKQNPITPILSSNKFISKH
jgi:hypothetical protein